ncbi:hypothetical protein PTKIN_Ptkin02bG0178600 [Pterospermum kingtungense]
MGGENPHQLHMFFFPFMGHGHMIPMVDMAKLFAMRGVKTTIVTTPHNVPFLSKTIQRSIESGIDIDIRTLEFPCVKAGLPEGCENLDFITTSQEANMAMIGKFLMATALLQEPLEQLIQECNPDCLVADMFFPWATYSADKFQIPRLIFNGGSFFSLCVSESLTLHEPYKKVKSDSEPFVIPNLPGDIMLTKKQIPNVITQEDENGFTKLVKEWRESGLRSYGVIVNSFYQLEAVYSDHYRNVFGRKAWHTGPVSLCNRAIEDKADRGKKASVDEHECLKWLDSKQPHSVVYICFGSVANFSSAQLMEIAFGIEASRQQFIWVVRKEKNNEEDEDWLPQGFEKRIEDKGLIIRGWAPQVLILDHEAVGAFVTHCGWNSTLEGICAGLPMVTWPVFAEQFYNEKQVTQMLKIGVGVGAQKWVEVVGDFVERNAIEKAVKEVMVGERAEEMRSRAKALGEMAKRAVEEGGSSFSDLNALVEELKQLRR